MEGLHSGPTQTEKDKSESAPMNQEMIYSFFAPRKGSGSKEGSKKGAPSKTGYPQMGSCAAAQPEVPSGPMDPATLQPFGHTARAARADAFHNIS